MERQPAIVRGLARRPPWGGIDDDTLVELYLSAAATVCQIAASGRRSDWRSARDLERAVIAAFRHEALTHWKTINAQKRRADRDAIAFDPERDGGTSDPLDRLYEPDPREELVARDWLAQLRGQVRAFWEPVVLEGVEYKQSGDRLGVTKAQRQALYREGIEHLGRFRTLLEEGRVCQLRASAITAYRAGTADEITAERARAHLDCCLACALSHEQGASALKRGILQLLPAPAVIARLATLARESPIGRAVEAGGALALGKGVAALCAGAAALGVCAIEFGALPLPRGHDPAPRHQRQETKADTAQSPSSATASSLPLSVTTPTLPTAPPTSSTSSEPKRSSRSQSTTKTDKSDAVATEFDAELAATRSRSSTRSSATKKTATAAKPPTAAELNEFDPETQAASSGTSTSTGATAGSRSSSTGTSSSSPSASRDSGSSATAQEFGGP